MQPVQRGQDGGVYFQGNEIVIALLDAFMEGKPPDAYSKLLNARGVSRQCRAQFWQLCGGGVDGFFDLDDPTKAQREEAMKLRDAEPRLKSDD